MLLNVNTTYYYSRMCYIGSWGLNKVPWNSEAKANTLVQVRESWGSCSLIHYFQGPCLESRDERRGECPLPYLWSGGCVADAMVHCPDAPLWLRYTFPWSWWLTGHGWVLSVAYSQLKGAIAPRSCPFLRVAHVLGLVNAAINAQPPHVNSGQLWWTVSASELSRGLAEASIETALQPNSSLYPFLLSSFPFHRRWCQEQLLIKFCMPSSISESASGEADELDEGYNITYILCAIYKIPDNTLREEILLLLSFADGEVKAQKAERICSKSHSWCGFKPSSQGIPWWSSG